METELKIYIKSYHRKTYKYCR